MLQGNRNTSEHNNLKVQSIAYTRSGITKIAPGTAQGAAVSAASLKGFLKRTETISVTLCWENSLPEGEFLCNSKRILPHLSSRPWRNTDIREQTLA